MRKLSAGVALAAFAAALLPGTASAWPAPGAKPQFKLFARALGSIGVNRVELGLASLGNIGVDSSGRGTTQGGFWPRGTIDNYIFNSGIQVAGQIQGTKPTNPWGGDTAGGLFFDATGLHEHSEGVENVFNSANSADVASWPSDAFVPQGDAVADLYATPLQGLVSASQGDVHFVAWEGNPALINGRAHPLGILADHRLLAWNYPAGNQDVVYVVVTLYNVTSANCSDYAAARAGIRDLLCAQGQKFQSLNNAKYGITLPTGGYTIGPMLMAYAADPDVGNASDNYATVNLPFAMGMAYDATFGKGTGGWSFDPAIFAPPFFAGVGFVGMKYLKGPDGPGAIQLFTNSVNGAGNADPANTTILYRILAGTPTQTDGSCDVPGDPKVTHICFVKKGTFTDIRMIESSSPLTLAPGEFRTIVVALIFAPPVALPGFVPNATTNVDPGDPTWTSSSDSMVKYNGANRIDSLAGFAGYNGGLTNGDGSHHDPVQTDFSVIKGSVMAKALVAQAVFNAKFLQEFAPDAPQFFLIPGDKQVTVLWKPSDTETLGDPFFAVVGSPLTKDADGNSIPNPLYDPNYRQFDVEGYRIYRGRSDSPTGLQLLAQFDYAGTTFKDFTGTVVSGNCAPELGIETDCPVTFPTPTNPTHAGTAPTKFGTFNIGPQPSGAPLIFEDQSCTTCRVPLAGGTTSLTVTADTAVSGALDGSFPPLADTGVPFVFIDRLGACQICGVVNGINYFYSVTAFDVNAPGHGPTSLESARVTKQVTPQSAAGNTSSSGTIAVSGLSGRGVALTDTTQPTIDTLTGEFSKKMPISNSASLSVGILVTQVLKTVTATVKLDSILLNTAASGGGGNEVFTEYMSVTNTAGTSVFSIPATMNEADYGGGATTTFSAGFGALAVDSASSSVFGGGNGFSIPATMTIHVPGGYTTGIMGRGCINGGTSGTPFATNPARLCAYNGPRWFIGDNETTANPNSDNGDAFNDGSLPATLNNAGALAGVTHIWRPIEYFMVPTNYRDVAGAMSPFITDADYRMYWGAGGKVDSVIDLTDNTVVPFDTRITSSWGFLNPSAVTQAGTFANRSDGALTWTAISCVQPLKSQSAITSLYPCSGAAAALSQTAVPGPVLICVTGDAVVGTSGPSAACDQAVTQDPSSVSATGTGFILYLKGHYYMMTLAAGVPASGTQWTVRDYTGAITGGNGRAGAGGKYVFHPDPFRPFTAPGIGFQLTVNTTNTVADVTGDVLAKVHTVPDPYYVTSAFDQSVDTKDIQFVNVPANAIIRIYTVSGVLVRVLQNNTSSFSAIVHWDVRNRTNQFVSSGVYFYNIEAGGLNRTGRMTIVNYASTVQ
ncbi:MAG TPA: T9SS type A sorting domain-containing protein [Gemmatimonadales bacterium]|jgi:hypothetical protein